MFGFKIISENKYKYFKACEAHSISLAYGDKPKVMHNCGYKSCQFQTTDMRGLKIHRARIHKNK